ncbi:UNVERIFIED_CONTAM: Retrovirus-related Pol polyprotein from transposon RE2 [Sesamum latifolium]|uniref:Retrovirus-related Pol polyprotein from transposon RE2 n=1 Tax=Sesamum latifolium TaxID=2727402 RepID=A0AAW2WDY7_9LAMI
MQWILNSFSLLDAYGVPINSDLPQGKNTIGCRWIYKVKLRPDGTVERCKARKVAKGFNQVEGIDYNDCFAPVAKPVTKATKSPGQVCKLKKSLYGLKQASRQWNQEFTDKIKAFGFIQSIHDYCLFVKGSAPTETLIQEVKRYLDNIFSIKDIGPAKYFLGLELARSPQGIIATQNQFALDIIRDTRLSQVKAVTTPLPLGLKFTTDSGGALQDRSKYRRLIGRLLYPGFTRPNICYAAQQLSQHVQHPCQQYWDAAMHLVKYIKATPSTGLFFPANNDLNLKAYCDANWAACPVSRRSVTGYCIFLGVSPVSWKTKKQKTVARSSAEAEYKSMASTTCEITWITYLLQALGVKIDTPVPFFCDNKAVLHITANPVFHERTEHLEIDWHVVRDKYKEGLIQHTYVVSKQQVVDIFTKPLPSVSFLHLCSKLVLIILHPRPTCGGLLK